MVPLGERHEKEVMAERVTRQVIDDLDGTDITDAGGETIDFAFRGVSYRIDLSPRNVAKFEKALGPYLGAAVKASNEASPSKDRSRRRRSPRPQEKTDSSAVRAWAAINGYTVNARGRIPSDVLGAFQEANRG